MVGVVGRIAAVLGEFVELVDEELALDRVVEGPLAEVVWLEAGGAEVALLADVWVLVLDVVEKIAELVETREELVEVVVEVVVVVVVL